MITTNLSGILKSPFEDLIKNITELSSLNKGDTFITAMSLIDTDWSNSSEKNIPVFIKLNSYDDSNSFDVITLIDKKKFYNCVYNPDEVTGIRKLAGDTKVLKINLSLVCTLVK